MPFPVYIYIYILNMNGWLIGFYGIATFVGYLVPNPIHTYIQYKHKKSVNE